MTTEKEISLRLERFQAALAAHEIDGALIVHKVDLYYLSGTDQNAHLFVPAQGPSLLMVRKSLTRAKTDSPLSAVIPLSGFSHMPEAMRAHCGNLPDRLGLEMDVLPAAFFQIYQSLFPDTQLVDISPMIRTVRMVKSDYEINCITRAAQMADEAYSRVPSFIKESRTETDLALRLEAYYRSKGHPGLLRARAFNSECFYGHILAGKSAAVASNAPGPTGGHGMGAFYSQGAGIKELLPHEPIMVDYTASVEGYVADQSRIFSLGRLNDHLYTAHNVMREVQDVLSKKGRPGARAGDLYEAALEIAEHAGLSEGFMGHPEPVPFVAHGVGLELDEWPVVGRNSDTILEKGMVLAMEPKVVFPEAGVVGVENTFVVTEWGMKKLNAFSDEIVEC